MHHACETLTSTDTNLPPVSRNTPVGTNLHLIVATIRSAQLRIITTNPPGGSYVVGLNGIGLAP